MESMHATESGTTLRAAEIARLVYFIQTRDMAGAEDMLNTFQKRGERVSREIMNAYWHQVHGCSAV